MKNTAFYLLFLISFSFVNAQEKTEYKEIVVLNSTSKPANVLVKAISVIKNGSEENQILLNKKMDSQDTLPTIIHPPKNAVALKTYLKPRETSEAINTYRSLESLKIKDE